jgi:hypothetical protein
VTHEEAVAVVRAGGRIESEFSMHAQKNGKCGLYYAHNGGWRTLLCDNETDVVECSCCGEQRVTACDFDEEYA